MYAQFLRIFSEIGEVMEKPWLGICLMVLISVSHPDIAIATDQERSRQNLQLQQNERIYGSQLMTDQERLEHRSKMRSAKSFEEQEQIRRAHHEKMKLRAGERGLTLPDEVPARGWRMAPPGCCSPRVYGSPRPAGEQLAKADATTQGVQNSSVIAYLSGGIGEDDPMLQASENYNLHMVFAAKDSGEYLAEIKVMIEDTKGRRILEAESPGPVFYVKLPAGSYRITAAYQGIQLRKQVTVNDRVSRDLYFHWPNEESAKYKGGV
jgi:hypothetical protein